MKRAQSLDQKQEHLRKLRPNLANPANKQETQNLNESETQRTESLKDVSY